MLLFLSEVGSKDAAHIIPHKWIECACRTGSRFFLCYCKPRQVMWYLQRSGEVREELVQEILINT